MYVLKFYHINNTELAIIGNINKCKKWQNSIARLN